MTRFNPEDPKWTAYILGELSESERAAVQAELESSEEARTLVDELRFAVDLTKTELREQAPILALTPQQREAIRAAAGVEKPRRWFSARQMAWAAGLAAAAGIALMIRFTPQQSFVEHKMVVPQESAKAQEPEIIAETKPVDAATLPAEKQQHAAAAGRVLSPRSSTFANPPAAAAPAASPAPAPLPPAGRVFGTINDASKATIPGATVAAINTQTGSVASTVTNDAGAYTLDGLQPGTYQIRAELPGFQTTIANGAQISAGDREQVDLTMQVAQAAQNVEVTVAAEDSLLRASAGQQGQQGQQSQIGQQKSLNALPVRPFAASAPPGSAGTKAETTAGDVLSMSDKPATASYATIRRSLNENRLPPLDAVRIEDMVNYFTYDYPQPSGGNAIGATLEAAAAPWNPQHRLVRIGIKAKDAVTNVNVQVEFNSAAVESHQLFGSEGSSTIFKDSSATVAGQTFTYLYEVVPRVPPAKVSNEMLKVKISYMEPNAGGSKSLSIPLIDRGQAFARASTDFRFAAAVASFGMILRDSPYKGTATFDSTLAIAEASMGSDRNGSRREFIQLVQRARQLRGR
jgi:hypothetical protein